MISQLTLGVTHFANEGDAFTFQPPKPDKTYVFTVEPLYAGSEIAVRKGGNKIGASTYGQPYAVVACGSDPVQIEVSETSGPFSIKVQESWWNYTKWVPTVILNVIPVLRNKNPTAKGEVQ